MKNHAIGIAALIIGIIALGLAVIPGIALNQPLPFASHKPDLPPPPTSEPKGGVTVKFKKFSVTFGSKKQDAKEETDGDKQSEEPLQEARETPQPNDAAQVLTWFTLFAVVCSLVGLLLGPISWVREKQPVLAGSAMGISCLALVWQYVVIGIAIGVAAAVLLIILSHFGS